MPTAGNPVGMANAPSSQPHASFPVALHMTGVTPALPVIWCLPLPTAGTSCPAPPLPWSVSGAPVGQGAMDPQQNPVLSPVIWCLPLPTAGTSCPAPPLPSSVSGAPVGQGTLDPQQNWILSPFIWCLPSPTAGTSCLALPLPSSVSRAPVSQGAMDPLQNWILSPSIGVGSTASPAQEGAVPSVGPAMPPASTTHLAPPSSRSAAPVGTCAMDPWPNWSLLSAGVGPSAAPAQEGEGLSAGPATPPASTTRAAPPSSRSAAPVGTSATDPWPNWSLLSAGVSPSAAPAQEGEGLSAGPATPPASTTRTALPSSGSAAPVGKGGMDPQPNWSLSSTGVGPMIQKKPERAQEDDCVKFWNLFDSLPAWLVYSEFTRQENKYNQRRLEDIHQEDLVKIQTMVEGNNHLTMEEATQIYYNSKEYETAAPTYQYQRGNYLVATYEEYKNLTTSMRRLHDYYIAEATETEQFGFEVIIQPQLVFHYSEEEKHGVDWECLFQLYQRRSLDTQILKLWTMCVAKHCLCRRYAHIAFLDPERVNEKTCGGIDGCDVEDLTTQLIVVFEQFKMHNKTHILLAYNCDNHFVFIVIDIPKNRIEVWDSMKKPLSLLDPLFKVLNNVQARMIGGTQVLFKVEEMGLKTLKQPGGNNECGFYVMWAMFHYLGGKSDIADELRKKFNHERLLEMEIIGMSSELASFILSEILERGGVFSIARSHKYKEQYGPERLARLL